MEKNNTLEMLEKFDKETTELYLGWLKGDISNSEYDKRFEEIRSEFDRNFEDILKRA